MIQSVDLPVMSQQHSGCYQILGMLCTCLCQMTSAIVLYNGQCGRLGWLPTPQQGKNASVEARGHCQLHCNLRLYRYRYGPLWLYPLSECVCCSPALVLVLVWLPASPCILPGILPLPFAERFGYICAQNHGRHVWEVFLFWQSQVSSWR